MKIRAEVLASDPGICKFVVDRLVLEGRCARFISEEDAKGSPLAEALFKLKGINFVQIAENHVTLGKDERESWRTLGPQVGQTIRDHFQSGAKAVSEEAAKLVLPSGDLRENVQGILDEVINPAVAMHGGQVYLIDVKGSNLFIQLSGGCQGCGMASMTLKNGIESTLRDRIPGLGEIFDVSDHAAGDAPYYSSSTPQR